VYHRKFLENFAGKGSLYAELLAGGEGGGLQHFEDVAGVTREMRCDVFLFAHHRAILCVCGILTEFWALMCGRL